MHPFHILIPYHLQRRQQAKTRSCQPAFSASLDIQLKMAPLSAFVLIALVFGVGLAELATPEPGANEPGLYLVTAGTNSGIIRPLASREQICLKDYLGGISVLCVGNSNWATFYINNNFVMKERTAPFYIRGDIGGRVRAWNPPQGVNWVKCRLRYQVVFKSRIYIKNC